MTADRIDFGAHKLPLGPRAGFKERVHRNREMLCRVLNMETTVAIVGSGCTTPLGYPTWTEFAKLVVDATIEALDPSRPSPAILDELRRFQRLLRTAGSHPPENRTFYISRCQQLLATEPDGDRSAYFKLVEPSFAKPRRGRPNPLLPLLALPIHRFMTTNYDDAIERALAASRQNVAYQDFGIRREPRQGKGNDWLSFTQERDYTSQLARFALARPARENSNWNMVFHCHGRFDRPASIVASERDYQRWYVGDPELRGEAFRQTVQLVLESNPLLFVGYGLKDDDLLRPLRQLGALDPARRESRPIFALMESTDVQHEDPAHAALSERYGLHVIPYQVTANASDARRGEALGAALKDLAKSLAQGREWWVSKPTFRQVRRARPKGAPCSVIGYSDTARREFSKVASEDQLKKLREAINDPKGFIVGFIGPGGTGKSWHAFELAMDSEWWKRDFDRAFYWNAHYAHEGATVLDQILAYLAGTASDPEPNGLSGGAAGTRQERLTELLARRKALIIIDGCERLVKVAAGPPGSARAYGPGLHALLGAVAEVGKSGSRVLLAGRLSPRELSKARIIEARRSSSGSVSQALFPHHRQEDVSSLSSLLKGHGYGLLLASKYLARRRRDRNAAAELQARLSRRSPKRRFEEMLVLMEEQIGPLATAFLERLSFFVEPISARSIELSFEEARKATGKKRGDWRRMLARLVSQCLVLEVTGYDGDGPPPTIVVHASVRRHFARKARFDGSAVYPDFAVAGSTAGTTGIDPGNPRRAGAIIALLERLCDEIEAAPRRPGAASLCRDAFGLVRGQMECTTASRWTDYSSYMRHGIRLARIAKLVAKQHWTYCDPHDRSKVERRDSPLYPAELSWLYNDAGRALFSEGLLLDAYSVLEQAFEINRVLEGPDARGEFVLESLLNLTHVLIEAGRLGPATEYLNAAADLNKQLFSDDETEGRILGFRAFLEHIQGNLEPAWHHYDDCTARLEDNPRAKSFFLLLESGVLIELGNLDTAERLLGSSRAMAEAGHYPDLAAFSWLRQGEIHLARKQPREARLAYGTALQRARELGMGGLEAFAHLRLSDLSLRQGDAQSAYTSAMRSLRLANEMGQGLMVTRSLLSLGRATHFANERQLGIAYLHLAQREAQAQGYGLRLREIERTLQLAERGTGESPK